MYIISFSSDGDRGHCPYQASLLSKYEELLFSRSDMVACCVVAFDRDDAPDPPIWWIADCLHGLKCQRCRLLHNLALNPGMSVINAARINATLHGRQSLTNLIGTAKMNDVFAVQIFSLENLLALFKSGDIAGGYYSAPFVT
jgi:hypothetical protein